MRQRNGFTLIELLTVTFILSILAAIAILKYQDLRNQGLSAQIVQEMRGVQLAVFNYFAEQEAWPAETGPGAVPNGLGPLLPGQLAGSFDRTQYVLDYENFGGGATDVVIGISVTTSDAKLFARLVRYMGNGSPFFVSGSKVTYLIAGPGGVY
jgi:prepilin-type N-terminal cleavage/methylation domain-containing protein